MKRILMCLVALAGVARMESAFSFNVLTPNDFIIAIDNDFASPFSDENEGEPASAAIDGITGNNGGKYLNFEHLRTGFLVTPGASTIQSMRLITANDAAGRDPASYVLQGTNAAVITPKDGTGNEEVTMGVDHYNWHTISQGSLSLPAARGAVSAPIDFGSNALSFSSYRLFFPTVKDPGTGLMQINEVEFFTGVGATGTDVLVPGLPIVAIADDTPVPSSNSPVNELPGKALDRLLNTKYLNFGKEKSGFIVTPAAGSTIVNSFSITTANDVPARDPASYEIWGTNQAITTPNNGIGNEQTYTLIASGSLDLPLERGVTSGDITFANSTGYSSYKVVFPTVRDTTTANSMQIAEFFLQAPDVSALVINRSGPNAGEGFIRADSGFSIGEYYISSASGLLNPSGWTSITSTGADAADNWTVTSSTSTLLREEDGVGGANNGLALSAGGQFNLGDAFRVVPTFFADGTTATNWEDAVFVMYDQNGNLIGGKTEFVGDPVAWGDYNGDGTVDIGDWPAYRANLGASFAGTTVIDAYLKGDLDGDFDNDLDDFHLFVDLAGGMGALFGNPVPEPSSIAMVALAGVVLLGRKRFRGWMTAAAALLLAAIPMSAEAQLNPPTNLSFTVVGGTPVISIPEGQLNENENATPAALFDDLPLNDPGNINSDLFRLNYTTLTPALGQYAIGGEQPGVQDTAVVFMDYGSSVTADWFAYSQRTGGNAVADKVGKFEFWFSNTDFAGTLPATAPNATFQLLSGDKRINDSILRPYTLGGQHSGRYVAMRLTETVESGALESTSRIGGHEFRLLDGPSDVVVDVNRATGEITMRNNLAGSATVKMKGYSIESPSGSLDPVSFNGVRGNGPFALGNGSGNGWEIGGGSSTTELVEAFFSGETDFAAGASAISLGSAYKEVGGVEDLVFKWTNAAGEFYNARVVYSGVAPGLNGDYNDDGIVNLADYTVWRDNLGASVTLPGDSTPGTVTAADYTVWKNNFGAGSPGAASGLSSTNVPEPSTLLLIAAAALPLMLRRRAS